MTDWQPIETLYNNPAALRPLLLWNGKTITHYGEGWGECILRRDVQDFYLADEGAGMTETTWLCQDHTCGDPDGVFHSHDGFKPTHYFPYPESPDPETMVTRSCGDVRKDLGLAPINEGYVKCLKCGWIHFAAQHDYAPTVCFKCGSDKSWMIPIAVLEVPRGCTIQPIAMDKWESSE